jgi:hypothetical protein
MLKDEIEKNQLEKQKQKTIKKQGSNLILRSNKTI